MKTARTLLSAFALALLVVIPSHAAEVAAPTQDPAVIAALTAADVERMDAMISAEPARLNAIFSDELRYAHSSGKVDHKASLIQSLVSRQSIYEKFDVKERTITLAGHGGALMAGRVLVNVNSGGQKQFIDLNYLSVWREENGKWRFLAWQSCRNPAPNPAPAPAKP